MKEMAAGMIHIGLFDGIGGFGMAAAWCGIETVVSCEIGAFGSDVLASLFPAAYHHKDIRTLTKTIIDERLISRFGADYGRRTILTGGGAIWLVPGRLRRRPQAPRYLWPEMLRIIGDVRPRWVIGENVAGILSGWYNPLTSLRWKASPICSERVTSFKRNAGNTPSTGSAKTLKPSDIPSGRWLFRPQAVGAPHRRDRVWFLASDAAADGADRWPASRPASTSVADTDDKHQGGWAECEQQENGSEEGGQLLGGSRGWVRSPRGCFRDFPNESPVRTDDDGICPESLRRRIRADFADCLSDDEIEEAIHRADKRFNEEALRAAGNAIVPQVAYEIIRGIVEIERVEHFPDVRKEVDKV